MSYFLFKRVLTLLATLLATSVIVFAVLEVLPGNAAQVLMGPDADPAAVAAWIQANNLLKSPEFRIERFGLYSSWRTSETSAYTLERDYVLG